MPYAQVSDVRSVAPHVPISAQSQPSEADVNDFLRDLELNLNATLASIGYQVPITGPNARAVLRLPLANAAMAMVMRSRPNPESDPEGFQRVYDRFVKSLTDTRDPYQLPDDAIRLDAPIKSESNMRIASELREMAIDDTINVRRNMKF